MENDKFNLLISILEHLEDEDINNSSISDAINRILDEFNAHLTEEQKEELLREFNSHEKNKAEQDSELSVD